MRRREYENLFVKSRRQQSLRDTIQRIAITLAAVAAILFVIWLVGGT
jgi:preprotein translocase subunit SecF